MSIFIDTTTIQWLFKLRCPICGTEGSADEVVSDKWWCHSCSMHYNVPSVSFQYPNKGYPAL